METVTDLAQLRKRVAGWRRDGARIGFAPTMGNLHAGHHALVHRLRDDADRVVASVFVNPTQFGPGEDFARYPRTLSADAAGLEAAGCDLLWAPAVDTMYPLGIASATRVRVPGITDILDGAHRPGHFDGVCTVVARLLLQVQPDVAAFGRKDYQQLAVVGAMVRDLAFPVALLPVDTVREADGLAMSSRNQYLDADARAQAPALYRALQGMRGAVRDGAALDAAGHAARTALAAAGFSVDYAEVRAADLRAPGDDDTALVALVAARLGGTRLVDNLAFDRARVNS